jgi:eukaryotic-like serine/threonine-protein kinase
MSRCTACATELPDLAVFCPRCGQANEPDFDRLLARRLNDRYQVYRRLGEGGLSTVFVATDTRADDIVVVKVSDPRLLVRYAAGTRAEAAEARAYWSEMIERMRREVDALADLRHPNIVRVLAAGAITDELRYVVMEFLRGRTLREELTRRGRFDFAEAARVGAEVAEGLSVVHARHIVHRDLTPRNIFLCDEGSEFGVRGSELSPPATFRLPTSDSRLPAVKVIDFGIAKFPQPPGAPAYTQHAVMAGTPGYAPPEQCQNLALDHRADIYSLGVVLYEMVTGRRPFAGRAATEIAFNQVQGTPPRPREFAPDLPLRFEALILRALSREPQARHQSAAELAAELRAVATRIVVPFTAEPVKPVAAANGTNGVNGADGAAVIKPIFVPLTGAFASPTPDSDSATPRAAAFGPGFADAGQETEPGEAEREVFPSHASQLQTVRQRRRRTTLATAAVVAFCSAALLVARPWIAGREAPPEQAASYSSPSPADSPPPAPDTAGQLAANAPTDAQTRGASAPSNSDSPQPDAPSSRPHESSRNQFGSRPAARRETPAPAKAAAARATAARPTASTPKSSSPPPVSSPRPASVPSPTVADSRLPEPSGTPEVIAAPPRPTPAPAPAPAQAEVASDSRRDDRGERRDDDWRRSDERGNDGRDNAARYPNPNSRREPPRDEPESGPKLYAWKGEVSRERQVTLEMPGEPGTIEIPRDYRKRVGVVEAPSPANGWRRAVLRVFGDGFVRFIVRWSPNRRTVDPRYQWSRRGSNTDD